MTQYDGILPCDKPYGISSHKVIGTLRQVIGQKKIGHTGTLDPRATGILLICLGRATKIAQFMENLDKTYEAQIMLGVRSTTFDSEGVREDGQTDKVPELTEDHMREILAGFKGRIMQKVPLYSAAKVGGRRLYKIARLGQMVDTPEKEVEIKEIKLLGLALPLVDIAVTCSKGTYIRVLANDIGEKIGCGGHLSRLTRIRVGDFELNDALNINEIRHFRQAGLLKRHIVPIESVLGFPSLKVDEKFSAAVVTGQSPRLKDIIDINGVFGVNEYVCLRDGAGRILAVGKSELSSEEIKKQNNENFFRYVRVLN
jgi:tRNA pseudouridine55 synthase